MDRAAGDGGRDQGISRSSSSSACGHARRNKLRRGGAWVRSFGYPFPRAGRRTPGTHKHACAARIGRTCWDLAGWRPHYSTGSPVPPPMLNRGALLLLDSWAAASRQRRRHSLAAPAACSRSRALDPLPAGPEWCWTMRPCLPVVPARAPSNQICNHQPAPRWMGWDRPSCGCGRLASHSGPAAVGGKGCRPG